MTRAQRWERMIQRERKIVEREFEQGLERYLEVIKPARLQTHDNDGLQLSEPMTTAEASERGVDLYGERE